MKFRLTNYGRIRTADIKLDGITVIAGPNGSGKSTISRALYTWFTFLQHLDEELPLERAAIINEDIEALLMECGVPKFAASRFMPTYFRNRLPTKILDPFFWHNEAESREWWEERTRHFLPYLSSRGESRYGLEDFYPKARDRVLARFKMDEDKLEKFILERYFLQAFDDQIGTLFDTQAESEIELLDDNGTPQSCSFFEGHVRRLTNIRASASDSLGNLQMFYLEPRHLLDEVMPRGGVVPGTMNRRMRISRYHNGLDLQWNRLLTKELDRKEMSYVQQERLAPILEELDRIVSVIHGEITSKDSSFIFKDVDIPGENVVSLRNIASGIKSIAAIVRGFRNDSIHPRDILIVDEPESNLHPEWQLSFAKFLVLLHARLDMRILLNTHSPYFLKAIEVYSDLFEQGDDCAFYNMTQTGGLQYDAECMTGRRIQEIFKSMSAPFSRLMHGEHYERAIHQ